MYDVIIIGAGPAGLMAGIQLQKAGVNYVIIDKKKELGKPVQCGEGIREEEFIEFFGRSDYSFVKNIARKHIVQINDVKREFECNIIELDRTEWEKWLGKGLNIELDNACQDIKIEEEKAVVETEKGTIEGKIIIIACGPNYQLQEKLGMTNGDEKEFLYCYGGIYSGHGMNPDYFYFFFDEENAGYLWVFPKNKDEANIGYGCLKGVNVKKRFAEITERYGVRGKQMYNISGIIPAAGTIRKTYAERIMACGDCAGMVYAGTGEGMIYALESGKLAGKTAIEAIQENDFSEKKLRKYETLWKKDFGEMIETGKDFLEINKFAVKHGLMERFVKLASQKSIEKLIVTGEPPWEVKVFRVIRKVMPESMVVQIVKIGLWLKKKLKAGPRLKERDTH